ncbi:MAG: hypothetical protein R3C45_10630 [Phycisphaerales bacterium]
MSWQVRFEEEVRKRHPRAGVWVSRVSQQPGWVTKTALAITLFVVVVPIVLLTLAAVAVGLICFVILGLVARAAAFFSGLFNGTRRKRDDGRRNVQVIDRY